MTSESAVAQYMLNGSGTIFMRQGVVQAYHAGPPPNCDVEINCEGLFQGVGVATPRAPFVGETVWIIEQDGRFVIMGIQQNAVPPASTGDSYFDPTIGGGTIEGPLIHNADLRNSTLRYGTYIGGNFSNGTFNRPVINDPVIIGGTFNGSPMSDNISGAGASIVRPNLQQPTIQSPTFDGGAQVLGSGAIKSANYIPGSEGWAIGGNGTAEFNNLLVRNSGIIGGVALGLTDLSGRVDGGSIASADFISGVQGWAVDGSGYAEFNSGFFRGSIAAGGSIDIGGADTSSFHVDAVGNLWLGSATYGTAPFKVSAAGAMVATGADIRGNLRTGLTGARVEVGVSYATEAAFYHNGTQLEPARIGASPLTAPTGGIVYITGPRHNSFPAPSIHLSQWEELGRGIIDFREISAAYFRAPVYAEGGGSAAKPDYSFGLQANMGMYRGSLNELDFSPNGVRAMAITPTGIVLDGPGIQYIGTNGSGTPNNVGFKWSSPNLYGRVDNAVECIVGTVSDRRLKDDLQRLNGWDSLDQIRGLEPWTFIPKNLDGSISDSPRRPGLIADEVSNVLPWAVPQVSGDDYQTVDYMGLVPVLVSAIQELERMVNDLRNERQI